MDTAVKLVHFRVFLQNLTERLHHKALPLRCQDQLAVQHPALDLTKTGIVLRKDHGIGGSMVHCRHRKGFGNQILLFDSVIVLKIVFFNASVKGPLDLLLDRKDTGGI